MTTITVTRASLKPGQFIWCQIDESGEDDVVTAAVVSALRPPEGENFWWKALSENKLSGIFNRRDQVTLAIDDECNVTIITQEGQ